MITAAGERAHIEAAIVCGETSMLLKPYSPDRLDCRRHYRGVRTI
jgi:response regulator of citrate/malate metabolism